MFSTPLKGHSPFDYNQLEMLSYTQSSMDDFFRVADIRHSGFEKRSRLKEAYIKTKGRLDAALSATQQASYTVNFGVRQEYRIGWPSFKALDLADETIIMTFPPEGDSFPSPIGPD